MLRAPPEAMLLAFGAADPDALDVYAGRRRAVAEGLVRRSPRSPPSLHCTVNAVHEHRIPELLLDVRAALDEVLTAGARGDRGAYGTVE
mgnify:CR=1 FL=1